jgi:FkbM family methyltransferase
MGIGNSVTRLGIRLFRSDRGQTFLTRAVTKLDLWRGIGAGAYVETSGEAVLFSLLRQRTPASRNVVVFDVGANVGEFTAAAIKALGERMEIHAFEPAKKIFEQLSARFSGDKRIVLNNVALGREAGEMALYGTAQDTGMASLLQRNLSHFGMSSSFQEMVEICRLADYCAKSKIDRIDLLKMDVEGFELEVLRGAEPLFKKNAIDMCSFEFGGCNLDSRTFLRDYFEFFTAHRMNLFRITPAGTLVALPKYQEQLERFTTTNYVAIHEDR